LKTTPASSTSLLPCDHLQPTHTMSDAEVKNDVAEAPSAEDLKAKKRSAEDDDVDVKKQKTENGHDAENGEDEEDAEEEEDLGEEEEDLDGEGEDELDEEDGGLFWVPGQGHFYSEENDEEGEEEEGEDEGEEGE